jgi:hypothetical protein
MTVILTLALCPTGKSVTCVSSPIRKNISLRDLVEAALELTPSRSLERGAARDRHGRWERDAVDATGALDETRSMRTAKSCGPDAPTLASSFEEEIFREATVANKPGHRGEREGTR